MDQVFNISVPDQIEGIPADILYPEQTWKDKSAFIKIANKLLADFVENAKKFEYYLSKEG
jgi:phosphoenolpyruvate carboxykinase (ATP)